MTELISSSTRGEPLDTGQGGFVSDTEIISERGAVAITDLEPGDRVYALDPSTRIVKLKPVTEIGARQYHGRVYDISARRTALRVAPSHPILYETKSKYPPRFRPAHRLDEYEENILVSDWRTPPREAPDEVDVTDFLNDFEACVSYDCHGHTFRAALPEGCEPIGRNQWTGYRFDAATFKRHQAALEELGAEVWIRDGTSHWRMPYRFQVDDFVQLIGWYVTEGSVTWRKNRDTAEIKIAQTKTDPREKIDALLNRMGFAPNRQPKGFKFGSKLYGRLLEALGGTDCRDKHLPDFVWNLPTEQQELLLQTLMDGDGNDLQTYYTTSDKLARDVCRLCTELGIKPRHEWRTRREHTSIWEIYISRITDQVKYSSQVSELLSSGSLFRLTVRDYPAVLAGRNGRYQWIGANAVS
jgi:DNA polymerase I